MVLPGLYPERLSLPFALDVVGRVKGKVRFRPPPEPEPEERNAFGGCLAEQEEDERAFAEILARHLGPGAHMGPRPVAGPLERALDDNTAALAARALRTAVPASAESGVACSLHAKPGGVSGRLVDVILEGGGIAIGGPGGTLGAPRPDSRNGSMPSSKGGSRPNYKDGARPDSQDKTGIEKWGVATFNQFDTNNDGTLTKKELSHALRSLPRKKFKIQSVEDLMANMDADGDGGLNLEEWLESITSCKGLAAALEKSVNAAGEVDGFRDPEKLQGAFAGVFSLDSSPFGHVLAH